jgi:hypothetical protein
LAASAGTLDEVVIAFVWPRAGGALVIISALAIVENFARGKEEHAEFEDKFTLLGTRLVSCGKSIPVYGVGDCVRPAKALKEVWVESAEALVYSNSTWEIAGDRASA